MRTTAQIWTFLDQDYGSKLELTSTLVNSLESFQFTKAARTDSERFLELYRAWTSVYNDLLYSGEAAVLNHDPTLDKFAKKLPSQDGKLRWIAKRLAFTKSGRSKLDAMVEFLGEERDHQRALGWLDKDKDKKTPVKNNSATFQGECWKCGRRGHKAGDCGGGGGGRQMAQIHASLTAKPDKGKGSVLRRPL